MPTGGGISHAAYPPNSPTTQRRLFNACTEPSFESQSIHNKKTSSMSPLAVILSIGVLTTPFLGVQAQNADLSSINNLVKPLIIPQRAGRYLNNLNTKAVRQFRQSFPDIENESWQMGGDCYRVKFLRDSIQYLVDYSKKGEWRNTIRIYNENSLPKDVRRLAKTTFFDHTVITVTELRYGKILAYFIKMKDKSGTKTVRVIDQQLEIVEEFIEQ
jgi:hypothetical protein